MTKYTSLLVLLFFTLFGYSQNGEIKESSELVFTETERPSIYPNPSYGILRVDLRKYNYDKFKVVIKNIIGKELWHELINSPQETIDLGFLSKGSYLLSIENTDGETLQSLRLVIIDP